jgi:hypothetical protein
MKPESEPALGEIAKLLQQNQKLQLYVVARLSHLEGIFDYVRPGRVVKPNDCNKGMPKTVAVKTYPL